MEIEELIKICKDRNELDFLYSITKQIAESDSIGEGYGYCDNYTPEDFNKAEKHIVLEEYKIGGFKGNYCPWLEFGGIKIYELYLKQIGVLEK